MSITQTDGSFKSSGLAINESDFMPESRVSVPLSTAEIRLLAELHLDAAFDVASAVAGDAYYGRSDVARMHFHELRFAEFVDLLPARERHRLISVRDDRSASLKALGDDDRLSAT